MGAEAIQDLLKQVYLEAEIAELKEELKTATGQKRVKAVFTDKSGFSNTQEINAKYLALILKSKNKCFLLMFNRADFTVGGGKKLSGPTS